MIPPTLDPGFTTEAMSRLLAPEGRVAAMCRFEAALARASAKAGVVPADVAERLVVACDAGVDDAGAILADGWEQGTPVLPLLARLRDGLDDEAAGWLHHGATTQDVVDTAMLLQARQALDLLRGDLVPLARGLREAAVAHRDLPATAWTLLQPAVPTTMGRRIAGWLSPVVTHLAELREAGSGLPVQLGGPSGTLDELGAEALAVVDGVASDLGLVVPDVPWHTDRTVVAALVGALERTSRTMARIGTDLALLAHDDVVRMRAGGSSSMPGKRNPIDATRAIAAAEACSGMAAVVTRGRSHELERGIGGWHAEWIAVPVVLHTTGAAVEAIRRAVDSLEIAAGGTGSADGPTPAAAGGGTGSADGPTPAAGAFVDRVVARCDAEVAR